MVIRYTELVVLWRVGQSTLLNLVHTERNIWILVSSILWYNVAGCPLGLKIATWAVGMKNTSFCLTLFSGGQYVTGGSDKNITLHCIKTRDAVLR